MNWRSRLFEEQFVSHVVMTPEIWSEDCCKFLMLATLVTHTYFHFFMQTGSRFTFTRRLDPDFWLELEFSSPRL